MGEVRREVENAREPQFDKWQHDFLRQCSEKKAEGISAWNKWRKEMNKKSDTTQTPEGSAIERLNVLKDEVLEEIENISRLLSNKS